MKIKPNRVKEKIKSLEPIICAFMRIPNPMVAEIMGVCGVELIVIDCEHFYYNVETIANTIRAAELYETSCLVRIGEPNRGTICNMLDMGAAGILLTNVENVEDVKKAVDAVKYYPVGHRGVSTDSRGCRYGKLVDPVMHSKYYNDNTIIAVVIETKGAVEEIDKILDIKEIDIVSVGEADLSYVYGHPGEVDHPELIRLKSKIYEKISASGKVALDKITTPETAGQAFKEGKRCFYITSDTVLLCNGLKNLIAPINKKIGAMRQP